ncbi:GntR family transcriptional regulator [Enterobacter cancerogenus]|uniref:GntR family transcriptional regulator n=1 Tax=Enterobacter cancerogenus TaxID=69218 RepID=UPI0005372C8F|nr:GntR family transcriptional regulator [Enterobacter cancerogenus]KGT88705.1 GntR family transcriptional regulator [Enterobacter cancerogenus]
MSKNAKSSFEASLKEIPVAGSAKLTHSDVAYGKLKKLILDGQLPAGTQLLEQEAAEKLSMSRTPVREAMIRLQQEGMVEIRPRHGMRILPVSAEDMNEIYQVLTSLEGTAVALLAENGLSKSQLAALDRALNNMDAALNADDLRAWADADELFHSKLVEFSSNKRLINMVSQLWEQSHRSRLITLRMRPKPTDSNDEHRQLLAAIVAKDTVLARELHESHRKKAGKLLVRLLTELGNP